MKLPNLKELMISLTDFKKQIPDIITKKSTKVIIKNNEPVSIFMPYEQYLSMNEVIKATGEDITLSNGVVVKVCVEQEDNQIAIKTYLKMKTSGEYKLHFTQYLGNPNVEQTLTTEELVAHYELKK
ncbi:prevent-host-death family protein [Bacillus sp. M6-12]|uniref:type II toxin-antitoxin system Phd/YefM family antitoxin n=1 Tax=Bacillus sp. M6-12 TaxID=2054166 RepID=UPI000C772896|nr:type II toxin-antitoxin system Phd/YefM family antitoxin [Bacillus sp. M6-12]PLS19237.1 prevent-host-death family protein [Bacillus sp. M6-12]